MYVDTSSTSNIQSQMQNYSILWTLPRVATSWTQLVKRQKFEKPILIYQIGLLQSPFKWLRRLLLSFRFVFSFCEAVVGLPIVDSLLGVEGWYYYMGLSTDGYPYYQLFRNQSDSLAPKYLYHTSNRWYVGSEYGSMLADLRSQTVGHDSPIHVTNWEKSTTAGLRAYLFPSQVYQLYTSIRVQQQQQHQQEGSYFKTSAVATSKSSRSQSSSAKILSLFSSSRRTKIQIMNVTDQTTKNGELTAFIYRLIEEGIDITTTESWSLAEVYSISTFCEVMKIPVPKEVQDRLRNGEMNGRILGVITICVYSISAVLATGLLVFVFIIPGLLTNEAILLALRGIWAIGIFCSILGSLLLITIFGELSLKTFLLTLIWLLVNFGLYAQVHYATDVTVMIETRRTLMLAVLCGIFSMFAGFPLILLSE